MLDFIFDLSDFKIFLLLSFITVIISIACILISKYFLLRRLRYRDNATIASISSLIGIIYGVLAGFIALYLLTNNDHASTAVQNEANALADIYRESQWLNSTTQTIITGKIKTYIHNAVDNDWPKMRAGNPLSTDGDIIIADISTNLKNYHVQTPNETMILTDLVVSIRNLYDARQDRIAMSNAQLSPELWEVIIIGTILIIGINYAFRVNVYLHLFAIIVFSIMAAAMLFLLITLDRPFRGEFIVEPDPLNYVLQLIEIQKNPPNTGATTPS